MRESVAGTVSALRQRGDKAMRLRSKKNDFFILEVQKFKSSEV
jgi:hypothetical protein